MNRQIALAALAIPALAVTLAFFVVPLVVLLAYSFMGYVRGEVVREATLVHYATLLGDLFYLRIIARTLLVAAVTTVLCVLLGYPVAWHIVRARPRWRPLLLTLILTPLLIGGVVRGYGWILILDEHGLVNALLRATRIVDQPVKMLFNFFGVVVTMVEVLIPFFILPLIGSLTAIDPLVERAALSMGATRAQTFLKVILPLSLPGLLAGASIVFSLALNIFVVPRIIGGASYLVLATLAYQQVGEVGNMPFGSAIAAIMLVLTLAVVAAVNLALGRRVQPAAA